MLTSSQQARIGQIAMAVSRASPMALATSFGSTLDGQSGGYAVPIDAARAILMPETGALLPYCRELPVTRGGSIGLPLDSATPYGDSNGIVAAWESEGVQLTQQKPKLKLAQFDLKKLVALVPATDQLLDDSDAMAAWLPLALQTSATFKVNDVIINGTGAGVPLGIRNSGALITVAKDGSQAAGTIVDANIAAMIDRALTPMDSMWVANLLAMRRWSISLASTTPPARWPACRSCSRMPAPRLARLAT